MIPSNQTADQESQVENKTANNASVNQSHDHIPQSLSPAKIAQVLERGQNQPQQQSIKSTQNEYPQYDWDNKWLKGDEYANMLEKIEEYCKLFKLEKFAKKTHPEDIYRAPQNGLIYFVEGNCVGSEFGFPRVPFRKQYRWKKMNFTTDLPKKRPQVTYIVASSVKCQKSSGNDKSKQDNKSKEQDVYRMHAVILYKNSQAKQQQNQQQLTPENTNTNKTAEGKQYILCHIRKMDVNDEDRLIINRVGANNNTSSSESSQDLIANSNSQRSGKANKAIKNKKLSISQNRQEDYEEEEDDENESDEIDEAEDDVKENQRQNKRKSSSIYEKSSNNDSPGNQVQTLHPRDTNKQSKAKSKHSNKLQSKHYEGSMKVSTHTNANNQSGSDPNHEIPTQFLQPNSSNKQLILQGAAQLQQQQQASTQNQSIADVINKKARFNDQGISDLNILNLVSQLAKGNTENIGLLSQNAAAQLMSTLQNNIGIQSPNNQRQRSPGNCEVNSITSSSNTHQNKEEDIANHLQQQQQKQGQNLISGGGNLSNVCLSNQIGSIPTGGLNNVYASQMFTQTQYPYQQGGMMMLQPVHAMPNLQVPYLQMYLNSPLVQSQTLSQQQQQMQNYLMQQPLNLQNYIKPPQVNLDLDFLNMILQSQSTSEFDYRNMYSMQMNSNIPPNSNNYLPNQRNQNAP